MANAAKSKWLRAGLLVLGLLVAGGLVYRRSTRALPVVASKVVRGRAVDAVYATGTVEAENRVSIKARSAGPLAEIHVKAGSSVKRGQLLARIDSPAASFELVRGQAELRAAVALSGKDAPRLAALVSRADSMKSELAVAQNELRRLQSLVGSGAVASAQLDRVTAQIANLEGGLSANGAEQRALRVDLDAARAQKSAQVDTLEARVLDSEVRAPLDGVVLVKRVELGEVVSVNQPLFLVGDTSSLILELDVDEADVARVEEGTAAAVTLLAFPDQVFEGNVFELLPDADRARKSFLAKVRLAAAPSGMRSGMTAEVNLIVDTRDGLLAPAAAEADAKVWVVRDGKVSQRSVRTGIRDPLRVELLSGVKEGELLVVDGRDKLSEGARVVAEERLLDKLTPMPKSATTSRGSL